MKQFLRNARVLIGLGDSALSLEGLRFRFECVKNQFSNRLPNQLTLVVYNLSKETRELVTDRGTQVLLEVGYGEVLQQLFLGQLSHAIHTHEGTEWLTTLYCWDQYLKMRESTINLSAKQGVSARFVLEKIIESFGETEFEEAGLDHLDGVTLLRPIQLTGPSRVAMDRLGSDYGFRWGFQDGRLEVHGPDSHFTDTAIVISSATGMINSPVVTDLGIEVDTLLNPRLRVNRQIIVESVGAGVRIGSIEIREDIPTLKPGTYTMGEIVFMGDTWGQDWISKIKTYRPGTALL